MNNEMTKQEWSQKEKRELYAKAVNSMLMTTPEERLEDVLADAKIIVDTAFENYPDSLPVSNWKDPIKEPVRSVNKSAKTPFETGDCAV